MTFIATWPAAAGRRGGCDAFDDEEQALALAQRLTANGHRHVVVYEVDDEQIERDIA